MDPINFPKNHPEFANQNIQSAPNSRQIRHTSNPCSAESAESNVEDNILEPAKIAAKATSIIIFVGFILEIVTAISLYRLGTVTYYLPGALRTITIIAVCATVVLWIHLILTNRRKRGVANSNISALWLLVSPVWPLKGLAVFSRLPRNRENQLSRVFYRPVFWVTIVAFNINLLWVVVVLIFRPPLVFSGVRFEAFLSFLNAVAMFLAVIAVRRLAAAEDSVLEKALLPTATKNSSPLATSGAPVSANSESLSALPTIVSEFPKPQASQIISQIIPTPTPDPALAPMPTPALTEQHSPSSSSNSTTEESNHEPCLKCGVRVDNRAAVCPHCGISLLVNLHVGQQRSPKEDYELAKTIGALGPPAPSFQKARKALASEQRLLIRSVSREFAHSYLFHEPREDKERKNLYRVENEK